LTNHGKHVFLSPSLEVHGIAMSSSYSSVLPGHAAIT
jgi:hypothetical protein